MYVRLSAHSAKKPPSDISPTTMQAIMQSSFPHVKLRPHYKCEPRCSRAQSNVVAVLRLYDGNGDTRDCRGCCWLVACLTSQQHASVSQGRICSDNFTCCHTEIEAADQSFYLTQSQYTDTGPTSPSADPITPGAWQGSHWSANF